MSNATLTINSRNYGAWSLRSWLLCRMAGLDFDTVVVQGDDPSTRAELLLLSPSFLVPCLDHDGVRVWDTIAIAEHLQEAVPGQRVAARGSRRTGTLPLDLRRDAFRLPKPALRAADEHPAQAQRVQGLFRRAGGHRPGARDLARVPRALRRPVAVRQANRRWRTPCTRRSARGSPRTASSSTAKCTAYVRKVLSCPLMKEWTAAAIDEPEIFNELEMEF